MATLSFTKKQLFTLVGKKLSNEEMEAQLNAIKCGVEVQEGDNVTVEIPPDRPDLYTVTGIARGLRFRLGIAHRDAQISPGPAFDYFGEKDALEVRPFIAGAVIEKVHLSEGDIAEIFQLQEKLDFTIGRNRRRVAIGLYDLDAIKPPLHFKAFAPDAAKFIPLKAERPMTLAQILETHPKGMEYARILEGRKKLPCLVDSKGSILSLIPIINCVDSAVTAKTTRLFIDQTATNERASNVSLNILCSHFIELGAKVTKVRVIYPSSASKPKLTPDTEPMPMALKVAYANKVLGTEFSPAKITQCLAKQGISSQLKGGELECLIPPYRGDFLHPIDLVEEVALGNGLENFDARRPTSFTAGSLSNYTLHERFVRDFMVGAGFLEVATHVFTNSARIKKALSDESAVELANPMSADYDVLRASILPSALELLGANTHQDYPQRIFETGEVVQLNPKLAERMETKAHLCAVSAHSDASITEIASVARELALRLKKTFDLKPFASAQFIDGRAAEVWIGAKKAGVLGELHPQVLENFGLQVPACALEIELDY